MRLNFRLLSFCIAFSLLLSLSITSYAAPDDAVGWYCKRNSEHKQPPLDTQLGYVEDLGGYYIDHKHGDTSEDKVVYLTFDAGYENGNIERILDTLKAEGVKGAFFVLGNLIKTNTELVIRMADDGHTLCNHTNTHKDMTRVKSEAEFKSELEALESIYREYTGRELSKYYRPPEGKFNRRTMEYANALGYKTIFWSFAYADWDNNAQMSVSAAKKKIMDNIHNGAVILLHPTSKTNADILGEVIRELKADGYRFGTLDELTK